MKRMKKLASLLLAAIMVMAMSVPAFAAGNYTLTIKGNATGHTYEAYQVFEGDLHDSVLSNIKWGSGVNGAALLAELKTLTDYATCDSAADVAEVLKAFSDSSDDLDAFAAVVGKHLATVAGTSVEGAGNVYTISNLEAGYYFVKDKDGTAPDDDAYTKFMLQVVKDTEADVKSEAPSIDKKIVEEDGTLTDTNSVSVGDTVDYKVTSKVPNMDGYETYFFIVKDTMSKGLTFKGITEIKVGAKTLTADTDYYINIITSIAAGDAYDSFEIVFTNFIQYADQKGADIVITYSAELNENAEIGKNPNTNEVELEYSNDPNVENEGKPGKPDEPGPDDPTGETPKYIVYTYVTGIELTKVDEDGEPLTGAEFTIKGDMINKVQIVREVFKLDAGGTYYLLKDGTYTTTAPDGSNNDLYESTTDKYEKAIESEWITTSSSVTATATVGADGKVTFNGLGEGTYTITEIKAPDGYNLLDKPIEVVITLTGTDASNNAIWSATVDGVAADIVNGIVTFEVENKSGATLPETGGIGTTLFYMVGGAMVLGAVVLLVTKKRMTAE